MSILDGISNEATQTAQHLLEPFIDVALSNLKLTDKQRQVLVDAKAGKPLAASLGITKRQLDAMLLRGAELLKQGKLEEAKELLTLLVALFPLDCRAFYTLGLVYQIAGEIEVAAKTFLFAIALDATNPDGHLRLGECLLSAQEYEKAGESFLLAMRLCAAGHGSPASRDHAERMKNYVHHLLQQKPEAAATV